MMKKTEKEKTVLLGIVFLLSAVEDIVRGGWWNIILSVAMLGMSIRFFHQLYED